MKKLVNFAVIFAVAFSMIMPKYGANTAASFGDVQSGKWFYKDVMLSFNNILIITIRLKRYHVAIAKEMAISEIMSGRMTHITTQWIIP